MYDTAILIGRFEPVHTGHLALLREALVQARRKGVTLHRLHQLLKQQGFDYSPSAFGKYAQKHLQTGLRKPPTKPTRHPRVAKAGAQVKPGHSNPRIASGNY